ncbi:MAG: hypothetical protein QXE45_04500 [Thermoplasmata archaeon]
MNMKLVCVIVCSLLSTSAFAQTQHVLPSGRLRAPLLTDLTSPRNEILLETPWDSSITGFGCTIIGGGTIPPGTYQLYMQFVDPRSGTTPPVGPSTVNVPSGEWKLFCVHNVNTASIRRLWVQAPGDTEPRGYKDIPLPDEYSIASLSELTLAKMPTSNTFRWPMIRFVYPHGDPAYNDSIFIGRAAGGWMFTSSAKGNIIIGSATIRLRNGYHNICIGPVTCPSLTDGFANIGIGVETALNWTTNDHFIAIGREALSGATSGSSTIGIGPQAGWPMGGGTNTLNNGIYIGKARTNLTTATGEIVIANDPNAATPGKGDHTVLIGGANITDSWIAGNVHMKSVLLNETNAAKPPCDLPRRGMLWFTQGGSGVKDSLEVCAKDATDTFAWRTIF